jgi:hypothetical protein
MYNTVNKEVGGYPDAPVTVDEIYDFIRALKHEGSRQAPDIRKEDISFCFHLLQASSVYAHEFGSRTLGVFMTSAMLIYLIYMGKAYGGDRI